MVAEDHGPFRGTLSTGSAPNGPAGTARAEKQDTNQFNVQSASVVRSFTKTRLPEMAGGAQVACSATL